MPLNAALIGYGAIAQQVLRLTQADPTILIRQILVRTTRVSEVQASVGPDIEVISEIEALSPSVDMVLECAGHDAVAGFGPEILEQGCDLGIVSVGILADEDLRTRLKTAAVNGHARLFILPGAIGGIDALAAAGPELQDVTYTSRKPPASWAGSPAEEDHDLAALSMETIVFSGNAREAAIRFPKNANVVATVALAGIGFERTKVTLIADPAATGNTHLITAGGPLFDLHYQTQGSALAANPKTSALTALSAVRALKHRTAGLVI